MLSFVETKELNIHHDPEMVKMAWRIARNNDFKWIPAPEDLARFPESWLDDILTIQAEVTRQGNFFIAAKEAQTPPPAIGGKKPRNKA